MRKFNKINKKIIFDDINKCKLETEKVIIEPNYKHGEKNPIIKITTEEELKTYLYPRIEYFSKNRSKKNNQISKDNIFKYDLDKILTNKKLKIYDNTDKNSTYNTIDYIFNNFNTAVFIQILNNKIYTFILLNNYKSHFNMLKYIKIDPTQYKNIDDFINKVNQIHYNNYNLIKKEENDIYFNNCSISLMESNNNNTSYSYLWLYMQIYDLINNLLKHKKINDIEFIFNYKDMHLLTKDGKSNPHYNIIGNLTTPLNKKYNTFIPILNVGSSINFADIPVPTYDDWEICTNKIFLGSCRTQYYNILDNINTDYDNKIPTAIFRGSATGCGVTIKNNPRLHIAYLSKKYYNHPKYGKYNKDGYMYLDAQIISYKYKVKKHYSENYINYINPKKLNIKLGKKLNLSQITNYKYIISIEGNIAAFRLSLELAYNSVILLVKSEFYIWYQPLLKPWIHYVPVKHDLSDLMDKIEWCRNNDKKCKIIAKNSVDFFKKYIQKKSIYDYMELILNY